MGMLSYRERAANTRYDRRFPLHARMWRKRRRNSVNVPPQVAENSRACWSWEKQNPLVGRFRIQWYLCVCACVRGHKCSDARTLSTVWDGAAAVQHARTKTFWFDSDHYPTVILSRSCCRVFLSTSIDWQAYAKKHWRDPRRSDRNKPAYLACKSRSATWNGPRQDGFLTAH